MSDPTFEPEAMIVDFQAAIRERLLSDTWFSGIDIFTPDDVDQSGKASETPADIEQRIEQSLSALSKGVCVICALPALQGIASDAPGIYAENVPVFVRVVENPQVNRAPDGTRKTYSMVGLRITRRLHHFTYRGCAVVIQRSGAVPDPENLIWDVVARTAFDFPSLEVDEPNP